MDYEELRIAAIKATAEANKAIANLNNLKAILDAEKASIEVERAKLQRLAKEVRYKELRLNKIMIMDNRSVEIE